jgi:hypothetical protein
MSANPFDPLIIAFVMIALLIAGVTADRAINYPLGSYVSTTNEYNQTFNESFSGCIVARNPFIAEVTIQNDLGEQKTLYVKWLNVWGNR